MRAWLSSEIILYYLSQPLPTTLVRWGVTCLRRKAIELSIPNSEDLWTKVAALHFPLWARENFDTTKPLTRWNYHFVCTKWGSTQHFFICKPEVRQMPWVTLDQWGCRQRIREFLFHPQGRHLWDGVHTVPHKLQWDRAPAGFSGLPSFLPSVWSLTCTPWDPFPLKLLAHKAFSQFCFGGTQGKTGGKLNNPPNKCTIIKNILESFVTIL